MTNLERVNALCVQAELDPPNSNPKVALAHVYALLVVAEAINRMQPSWGPR